MDSHFGGEAEPFEEGLVHLVDMLTVAKPSHGSAQELDLWRAQCARAVRGLEDARSRIVAPESRARLDAAIQDVRRLMDVG